jgi:hypothetical protein
MVAVVVIIVVCFSSDHFKERPRHMMAMSVLAVVCISVVAGTSAPKLRYGFLCVGEFGATSRHLLCVGMSGVWGVSPLNLSYLSNTISHPQQKRAIVIALIKWVQVRDSADTM